MYKGIPIRLSVEFSADFSAESLQDRKELDDIFDMLEKEKLSSKNILSGIELKERESIFQSKAEGVHDHEANYKKC